MLSRRTFLGTGTAAGIGVVADSGTADSGTAGAAPAIRRHVTLGKTGLEVSEIGFGSASSQDPDLVRRALDRGVTFFDTAESYRFGWSEEAMGEGLKGVRDEVVLTSKTKAGASDSEADMMAALEGSLKRLQTDYLDIYFNHAVNSVDRMQNEAWAGFTERAKEQGKIRFRGMSGHGSRLARCLDYAIDEDLVDVILCAYSFGEDPDLFAKLKHSFHFVAIQSDLPPVLDKARAKDIGVIAMKTLMGARLNDMRPFEEDGRTYAQGSASLGALQPARRRGADLDDQSRQYRRICRRIRTGGGKRRETQHCSGATPRCSPAAIAAMAAAVAREPVPRVWRSPRFSEPACTMSTTAIRRWRSRIMPSLVTAPPPSA